MPSLFGKIHRQLKQKHCDLGHCMDTIAYSKKVKHRNRIKGILNTHKKQVTPSNNPSSFYTSGIYGTNNCNASMNHLPRKTKSELALESVDNVLNTGGSPTEGKTHIINKCQNVEKFGNITQNTRKSSKIILIILLILIVVCLICCIICYKRGRSY